MVFLIPFFAGKSKLSYNLFTAKPNNVREGRPRAASDALGRFTFHVRCFVMVS